LTKKFRPYKNAHFIIFIKKNLALKMILPRLNFCCEHFIAEFLGYIFFGIFQLLAVKTVYKPGRFFLPILFLFENIFRF